MRPGTSVTISPISAGLFRLLRGSRGGLQDALAQPDLGDVAVDRGRELDRAARRERQVQRGLRRVATAAGWAAPDAAARAFAGDRAGWRQLALVDGALSSDGGSRSDPGSC